MADENVDKKPNLVDKQARDFDYESPRLLLDPAEVVFGGQIPLDPATAADNPTNAWRFFTEKEDGLVQSWGEPPEWEEHSEGNSWGVYVNPPYGPHTRAWVAKILGEARGPVPFPILAVLSVARTEQLYFQELMYEAGAVCWAQGRVPFIRPSTKEEAKQNPSETAIWAFNIFDLQAEFVAGFKSVGLVQVFDYSVLMVAPAKFPKRQALSSMKKKELLAELDRAGITNNGAGPISKQSTAILRGMLQKIRDDQNAQLQGAGPCHAHPDQVDGVCPYCRGIWTLPTTVTEAPRGPKCSVCGGPHMHYIHFEPASKPVDVALEGFC